MAKQATVFVALLLAALSLLVWRVGYVPESSARWPVSAQRWLAAVQPEPDWSQLPTGDLLAGVQQRGTLVVAVRAYQRPAPSGAPTPAEPDGVDAHLARFVAKKLGVQLQLVGLQQTGLGQGYAAPSVPVDLVLVGAPAAPSAAEARVASVWTDRLALMGSAHANVPQSSRVPTAYLGGAARLVVLRNSTLRSTADLRGRSVCVQSGSAYAQNLAQTHGVLPRSYPSGVHAIYAFMGGECDALAEDEALVERLSARPTWRFYRTLPSPLQPDTSQPQVVLTGADAASAAYVDRVVRYWKAGGALSAARDQRVGDVSFELTQLEDGLICHS